jgi:hypothetical protein
MKATIRAALTKRKEPDGWTKRNEPQHRNPSDGHRPIAASRDREHRGEGNGHDDIAYCSDEGNHQEHRHDTGYRTFEPDLFPVNREDLFDHET